MQESGLRLSAFLSPAVLDRYKAVLSPELQEKFETEYHGVQRWNDDKLTELKGDFTESDLEHVCSGLEIIHSIQEQHPEMAQDIDFETVEMMYVLHDIGEIGLGDLPMYSSSRDSVKGNQKKRIEAFYAKRYLFPYIKDVEQREQLEELFDRVMYRKCDDKEALFVKFVDIVQGTQTGIDNIFGNYSEEPSIELKRHISYTLYKLTESINNLIPLLNSNSQRVIYELGLQQFTQLAVIGYEKEVEKYIRQLRSNTGE
ncbi:MAG TPA: HD domain-containing protein [Candidatus Nitrosocosmicus sp.]|nr:HD domain-containing protein [Candidatus Nitrosocosmicus sp.]